MRPIKKATPVSAVRWGGAGLTPLGHKLIKQYRAIEARALAATGPHLHEIESSLKDSKALRPMTSISLPMRSRG
jgi:molybdenum-dependent DNA-binding transcriptional regulator ModE